MESIVLLQFLLFLCVHFVCGDQISEYKTVETRDGLIRGRLNHTLFHKRSYYSFLGIPYAEKPINDLRFKV